MKRICAMIFCLIYITAAFSACSDSNSSLETNTSSESSSDIITEPVESSVPDDSAENSEDDRFDIKKEYAEALNGTLDAIAQDSSFEINDATVGEDIVKLYDFTNNTGCYPVYKNESVEYYPTGEQAFDEMIKELEKADDFIFLEYFIINEGEMWDKIYDILKRKASQGVDVRLIYDGLMEGTALSEDFPKELEENGIKCHVFSPISGEGSLNYNTRDHRKILVVDGRTAFTGGLNIADEYINITHPYGIWKDNSIKIEGDAVGSFTLMFLQMWSAYEKESDISSFLKSSGNSNGQDGYIMPFCDNPFDEYSVSKSFYMSILETAKDYVYIFTPYLLPDTELENSIKAAAQRGVDVRIFVPGIPDKVSVSLLTKSHYRPLINSGVRIFEYSKGFVHSKVFVSDDIKAIVGTINLDNRSLIYHFECGAYIYNSSVIDDIKKDFTSAPDDYTEITAQNIDSYSEAGGFLLKSIEGFL